MLRTHSKEEQHPASPHHPSPQEREAWWRDVYQEWRLPVLRYVHRLTGDAHLAEDIAQDTFLRLLSNSDATPATLRSTGAWLFRVAGNLVRDGARRAVTRDRAVPLMQEHREPPRPDHELELAESVRAVRTALERLSARDRDALLMRQAGFEYSEIAEVLGLQAQSVPTVVMRALRRFRAAYLGESSNDR